MTELADLTTLRVGGPAKQHVIVHTDDELIDKVTENDEAGESVLLVGGGSNLVVSDDGFLGTVVQVATRGIKVNASPGGLTVTVAAGENWDEFVASTVREGWGGIEALSGIPGLVGSTPFQNVGAYGQEVSQTILRVQVYDRRDRVILTLPSAACRFGYRDSIFKRDPESYVILAVVFQFDTDGLSRPIQYAELARRLGVDLEQRAPVAEVREAVLKLRRSKGMVLDPDDHDTWSAGSFFVNPVLSSSLRSSTPNRLGLTSELAGSRPNRAHLPSDAPRYVQPDGSVKTSAAWLIEHAGFGKGYGNGLAAVSTKHTLALTNRGGARTRDILALAREIRDGVQSKFGILIEAEPILVGCNL